MTVPVIETVLETNIQGQSDDVTAPDDIEENDMVLIIVSLDGDAENVQSVGFTVVSIAPQGDVEQTMLIKRATASEPSTYTLTWNTTERGRATVLRISGCPTTGTALDQVDVIGAQDDGVSGTSISCPLIVSTVIDTLAIAAVAVDGTGVQTGDGFITPNGFVVKGTPGNNGNIGAGGIVGSKDLPSIGGSLSPEFGWTNSDMHVCNMINLKGVSGPPPVVFSHSQVVIIG